MIVTNWVAKFVIIISYLVIQVGTIIGINFHSSHANADLKLVSSIISFIKMHC